MLDIINIPAILGRETHSFKRANVYDKLDLGLATTIGIIGTVVLLLNGFTSPLVCVPSSCSSSGTNPSCALDWAYQNTQCKVRYIEGIHFKRQYIFFSQDDVMSTPDSSFHYLLLGLSLLLTGLLTIPIYWGSNKTKELFDNFYYIWAKMKNGDEDCKDVEWRRRMNFVLDQLKTSNSLTTRYALYHGLAVISDLIALTLVLLYTLNFTVFGLDSDLPPLDLSEGYNGTTWSSFFRSQPQYIEPSFATSIRSKCAGGSFVCDLPNRDLFKWFGIVTSMLLTAKLIINVKCLLFSLGIPGLFGRNFLIYADQLNDNFGEKLYNVQINPVIVLLQTVGVFLRLVFIAPLQWTVAFANFYFQRNGSAKDFIKRLSAANTK